MRTEMLNFRVTPELLEALAQAAQDEQVSRSELMRRVLTEKIGSRGVEVSSFDPKKTPQLASRGNISAQHAMACRAWDSVNRHENDPALRVIDFIEALTFARMAALQGEQRDAEVFVFLLSQFAAFQNEQGRSDIANRFEAAALNAANILADEGNEAMADMIARSGDALTPAIFEEARRQREAALRGRQCGRREAAREELFGGGDEDNPAGLHTGVIPPPPGFTIVGERGSRNVYADLKYAIPGVRFTSGYRDQAYQEDMRRRGYKPAWNSEHLDGSSLDKLPPPGKSIRWLKAQVKRYDPKAKLLIHDGHLHASFPGYYGAPTFEGARDAGVKNPLEGMPPPPPGFTIEVP